MLAFFDELPREAVEAFGSSPWAEVLEGLQQGLQQGMQQGTRAEAVRAINLILVNRFRMVPGTVTGRLEEIAEVERLEALMKTAVTASSADEFFAALDSETAR